MRKSKDSDLKFNEKSNVHIRHDKNKHSFININDDQIDNNIRNVYTDASSMTRCVQLNQTKCTSTRSSKELRQSREATTTLDHYEETKREIILPKRLYSLEEINKDHKRYIRSIKSKIK